MNIQEQGLCTSALSLNIPLVAVARKQTLGCTAIWSTLVQLLRSSLLLQFLASAQGGSRLLRFSTSTHLTLTVSIQHRRATGGQGSMLDSELKNSYNPKYPLPKNKDFFPRYSPANWCQKAATNVRNSGCLLVTVSSFPEVLALTPPKHTITWPASIYSHLLTGI